MSHEACQELNNVRDYLGNTCERYVEYATTVLLASQESVDGEILMAVSSQIHTHEPRAKQI